MLDLRRLRLLREVALRGTLADVATSLHLSPSSVSQQLALLAHEVGVPLLVKSGRGVRLTPQAQLLVKHTTAVLERLEQAETELAASFGVATGTVRVAAFQSAALALMPGLLTRVSRDHPQLRVTLTQREPETAMRETWGRDFDLVVAEQYPGHTATWHDKLETTELVTDAIRLAVPRGSDITGIRDAAELPWTMEPDGVASRHFAEQTCRQADFEPDVRYETADLQAQIRLVESGHAVALLPDLIWRGRTAAVQLLDLPGAPRRTVFTAVRAASAHRPGILACRAALHATASEIDDEAS